VLIPLVLIVFGMIDFGRALYAQITLDHVAREGVRIAALGSSPTADSQWVSDLLTPAGLAAGNVSSTVCGSTYARVVVTQQFSFVTPLPALVPGLASSMTLTDSAVAKCYS
jgi:Flp pilus assembly protein TadG